MMKTAFHVLAIMAILHILGALGFVGYMVATDRVNRERLEAVRAVFEKTIAQAAADAKEQAKVDEAAAEQAQRIAALEGKNAGPETVSQKLEGEQERNEITLRQLERTRQEVESLQRSLQLAQQRVEGQYNELLKEKQTLQKRLAQIEQQRNDEGFKKTVELYETLPPKQVKEMFVKLMSEGGGEHVVAFLEAMQPRKAAGVLKEFKTPEEVAKAVQLTEQLRARGSDLVKATESVG
ncbi:MAG: hypothetical protein GC162_12775 [Planctomycetes bacterium]|nr:hypothetical protein [Planctomycetota bacterium]